MNEKDPMYHPEFETVLHPTFDDVEKLLLEPTRSEGYLPVLEYMQLDVGGRWYLKIEGTGQHEGKSYTVPITRDTARRYYELGLGVRQV